MALADLLRRIFGNRAAGVDVDDVDQFWQVEREVNQAKREGADVLAAVLKRYGFVNLTAWDAHVRKMAGQRSVDSRVEPVGSHPSLPVMNQSGDEESEFKTGAFLQLRAEYRVPVDGVALDRLAVIDARLEIAGADLAAILAEYGLDEERWRRATSVWRQRFDGADAHSAKLLRAMYREYHSQAKEVFPG